MTKIIRIILITSSIINLAFSDSPDAIWTRIYDIGNKNAQYFPERFQSSSDSSLIIAGHTTEYDLFLLKTNSAGDTLFLKTYNFGNILYVQSLQVTNLNTYIITGSISQNNQDLFMLKTDSDGNEIWRQIYGGQGNDIGNFSKELKNEFIITVGRTYSFGHDEGEMWILKTDLFGDTIWTKTLGTAMYDGAFYAELTADEYLLIAGKSGDVDAGPVKPVLIKMDLQGNVIWYREYDTSEIDHVSYCKELDDSGDIILAGREAYNYFSSGRFDADMMLIKTDSDGNLLWKKTFGDEESMVADVFGIEMRKGYLIYGKYSSMDIQHTYSLVRVDDRGDDIWYENASMNKGTILPNFTYNINKSLYFCAYKYDSNSIIPVIGKMEQERITASFYANLLKDAIPANITFYDSSQTNSGDILYHQWDFENNGIIDSYEQNPLHSFFTSDSFTIKLVVSNGILADTLVKEKYITTYRDTFPKIYQITDLPNDQGGEVQLHFGNCIFDTDTGENSQYYSVLINNRSSSVIIKADGQKTYSAIIPTGIDSTADSPGIRYFKVIAHMDEGNFYSNEMAGYSVDNIYPTEPSNMFAALKDSSVELAWDFNIDDDFGHFNIYRKTVRSSFQKIAGSHKTSYSDFDIVYGRSYEYAVSSVDDAGNESQLSDTVSLLITNMNIDKIVNHFYLAQNYPNPFNPVTHIKFGLPKPANVKIIIYDILGRQVRLLSDEEYQPGHFELTWAGKNDLGQSVNSGIYYYKIITDTYISTKKMILIK